MRGRTLLYGSKQGKLPGKISQGVTPGGIVTASLSLGDSLYIFQIQKDLRERGKREEIEGLIPSGYRKQHIHIKIYKTLTNFIAPLGERVFGREF